MAKNSQNELISLLEEANQDKGRKTKQKGPKTVIVEEPLAMSGDPLGLIQTNKQMNE